MKNRDIERVLSTRGIGSAKLDIVTRQLRNAKQLRIAARGQNAPEATARSAAKILIATAGSAKGVSADRRLQLLRGLKSDRDGKTKLITRLGHLLDSSPELEDITEFRIGRNVREASLRFVDGSSEVFRASNPRDYSSRLRVEGSIPGILLRELAQMIAGKAAIPPCGPDEEPDSD